MQNDGLDRRSFLKTMSSAGMLAALPEAAFGLAPGGGHILHETAEPGQEADAKPKYSIKFSVCGISHDHIHGMIGAIQRGGGELVSAWGGEEDKLATFTKRYPNVEDRDDAGRDPQRSLHSTCAELANRQRARRHRQFAP